MVIDKMVNSFMEKKIYYSPQTEVMPMMVSGSIMVTSIGGTDGSGLPTGPGPLSAHHRYAEVF